MELTFHMNTSFKTWRRSLQFLYANEAKFCRKQPLPVNDHKRLDIVCGRLREVRLYKQLILLGSNHLLIY